MLRSATSLYRRPLTLYPARSRATACRRRRRGRWPPRLAIGDWRRRGGGWAARGVDAAQRQAV